MINNKTKISHSKIHALLYLKMWQSKRLSSLDTLKDDIGDSVFISNTFPLRSGIYYQYKAISGTGFLLQCGD